MSNAAKTLWWGNAGEREGRRRVPDRGRVALVLRIRKRMDANNTAAGGGVAVSEQRNEMTGRKAVQAPRRYFETSLQWLRSFGRGAGLGHHNMSMCRRAQSSLEALFGIPVLKRPDRDLHHVPLRNLPSSYCSDAQHPRTTPLLVPIRNSSIHVLFAQFVRFRSSRLRYYSTALPNPQLTISRPLPRSYQSPSSVILSIDQLRGLFRNRPRTQYSSQELP
jgi:hypothetical protein